MNYSVMTTENFAALESLYSAIEEKFAALESLYSAIEEKFAALETSISILDTRANEEGEEVHIMNYSVMTTEQLESLRDSLEEKINEYVGMSFMSSRSELVSYEIDSVDSEEIFITANRRGVIRDYTVDIVGGVQDDVDYNHYNEDGLVDGGYVSFDRLPKSVRNAVLEIYALYIELGKVDKILDTRSEEEEEVDNLKKLC